LQTVQSFDLQGSGAAIKWVNDVLVENRKVGGVLARLQKLGQVTESAVMGIGLNVSASPAVTRDSFVPGVAAIADFVSRDDMCRHIDAFPRLIHYLGLNLQMLMGGGYPDLLKHYRNHSVALGREVGIFRDSNDSSSGMIASGCVAAIGESLELFLEGRREPLTNGRLKLL
jgi:BirA family biotin operon repressor/biotin-[acetyl-CoA-carboxylase] ligase